MLLFFSICYTTLPDLGPPGGRGGRGGAMPIRGQPYRGGGGGGRGGGGMMRGGPPPSMRGGGGGRGGGPRRGRGRHSYLNNLLKFIVEQLNCGTS